MITIKISPLTTLPINNILSKATIGSSGFDITYLGPDIIIPNGKITIIPTGLYLNIPFGWEGQIRPRSGLALKGINIFNSPGTIDSDYKGEIKILLNNTNKTDYLIESKSRIAQLVFSSIPVVNFEQDSKIFTLSNSDIIRGGGGFGSTGI